ncbi:MAG: outer membrane beta-barrel protein [Gemmataceae bacterium]|nr:outer membrane beta-barrel protein [Gemmataceae bacterium]
MLLALSCSTGLADDGCSGCASGGRTYASVFGGGGGSSISNVTQSGVALFADPPASIGPLRVQASGSSENRGVGLVGLQIGHEFGGAESDGFGLVPAMEFEGFYLTGTQKAHVEDLNTRLPDHSFDVTLPMDNWALLANVVINVQTPSRTFTPYFGGGIGTANISISGADSLQVSPPEAGVNHFNSGPNSSAWGFAAQAKVGLKLNLTDNLYVFGEYRYLYVSSTTYLFGSTVAPPPHVPTSNWSVQFNDMSHHLGVAGIGFRF